MSVIIRLQNLPWSANSKDVRHFFEGLDIPEGGVHIIGGDEGDAFIAFNLEEDAYKALHKDGQRLKGNRLRLFPSSLAEMQDMIDFVRRRQVEEKYSKPEGSRVHARERDRSPGEGLGRRVSAERLRRSPDHYTSSPLRYSRQNKSPERHRDRSYDRHQAYRTGSRPGRNSSRSPVRARDNDAHLSRRSPNPWIDSFQSGNFGGSKNSREESGSFFDKTHSMDGSVMRQEVKFVDSAGLYDRRSPVPDIPFGNSKQIFEDRSSGYDRAGQDRMPVDSEAAFSSRPNIDFNKAATDSFSDAVIGTVKDPSLPSQKPSGLAENASGKEVLNSNSSMPPQNLPPPPQFNPLPGPWGYHAPPPFPPFFPGTYPPANFPAMVPPFGGFSPFGPMMPPPYNVPPFPPPTSFPVDASGQVDRFQSPSQQVNPAAAPNYGVKLSGVPQDKFFIDVQALIKDVYAPYYNIKWERNSKGENTGVVYVRLSNKEDFDKVMKNKVLIMDKAQIEVERCSDEAYNKYFGSYRQRPPLRGNFKDGDPDLCYKLSGLPYETNVDSILSFFSGLNLSDVLIIYDKDGKATGTGFVQFKTVAEYQQAFERSGKRIGRRYVRIYESKYKDMEEARNSAIATSKPMKDLLSQNVAPGSFTVAPTFDRCPKKRPLCAVLVGLPSTVQPEQIYAFFEEAGARTHAVHILISDSGHPSGRAFAEFQDLFDFDNAMKQHQKTIEGCVISVKQILFEEMLKILDSHQALHTIGQQNSSAIKPVENDDSEKVPYLWEPPDETEEIEKSNQQNIWMEPFHGPNMNADDAGDSYWRDNGNEVYNNGQSDQMYNNSMRQPPQGFDPVPTQELGYQQVYEQRPPDNFDPWFNNQAGLNSDHGVHQGPPAFNENFNEQPVNYDQRFGREGFNDFERQIEPLENRMMNRDDDSFRRRSPRRIEDRNRGFIEETGVRRGAEFDHRRFDDRSYENVAHDEDRNPVKFEMKGRHSFSGSGKLDNAFSEHEEKRVLKKLTPDRDSMRPHLSNEGGRPVSKHIPSRDRKQDLLFNRNNEKPKKRSKDNSPCDETRAKRHEKPRSPERGRYDTKRKIEAVRGERDRSPRGRLSRSPRRGTSKSARDRRSPVRKSPPRRVFKDHERRFPVHKDSRSPPVRAAPNVIDPSSGQFGLRGCTIQADNVPPDVGLPELMDFFRGYRLCSKDIIRRFADDGMPTGDVRIAFRSSQDAASAMRKLNGAPLRGVRINMFFT